MRLLSLETEVFAGPGEYFVTFTWENEDFNTCYSCATVGFSVMDILGCDEFGGPISDSAHDMIMLLEPNIFGGLLEDYIPF